MGKTPAQENRAKAKKDGQSHDAVKKQAQQEGTKMRQLASQNAGFGDKKKVNPEAMKAAAAKQRAKDLTDPTTEAGKAAIKAAKKAMKEEMEFLMRNKPNLKQPPLEEGQDPKSVLCVFFKEGVCAKGDKCKYSHDLQVGKKKRNIYEEEDSEKLGDTIDMWNEEKLNQVIAEKHGKEENQNLPTLIVCKHFLDAVDKKLYGWFWKCPDGKGCKYKHKLPPGYKLPSELMTLAQQALTNQGDSKAKDLLVLDELKKLARLKLEGKTTPLTEDKFKEWKKARESRLTKERAESHEKRRREANGLTGRELVEAGQVTNDHDDADVMDFSAEKKESQVEEERLEAQAAQEAAEMLKQMALEASDGAVELEQEQCGECAPEAGPSGSKE